MNYAIFSIDIYLFIVNGFFSFYRVRSCNISPTPSLAEDLTPNNITVNSFSLPGQSPRLIRARLPRDETCEEDENGDEIGKGDQMYYFR